MLIFILSLAFNAQADPYYCQAVDNKEDCVVWKQKTVPFYINVRHSSLNHDGFVLAILNPIEKIDEISDASPVGFVYEGTTRTAVVAADGENVIMYVPCGVNDGVNNWHHDSTWHSAVTLHRYKVGLGYPEFDVEFNGCHQLSLSSVDDAYYVGTITMQTGFRMYGFNRNEAEPDSVAYPQIYHGQVIHEFAEIDKDAIRENYPLDNDLACNASGTSGGSLIPLFFVLLSLRRQK